MDLYDEYLVRLLQGETIDRVDRFVAVRLNASHETLNRLHDYPDADMLKPIDELGAMLCVRASQLFSMARAMEYAGAGRMSILGVAHVPQDSESCTDAEWMDDRGLAASAANDTGDPPPVPVEDSDEDIRKFAEERDLEFTEVKDALNQLGMTLTDLKEINFLGEVFVEVEKAIAAWGRRNLGPNLTTGLQWHLLGLLRGDAVITGVTATLPVGVRTTGESSVEDSLNRFAQLTEVQVLDSLKGYDKVLCVSYHRLVQLADVPGVEHIKELAFPLPADEKRASATHTPEQMKSLETDLPPNEDILFCQYSVLSTPR